MRGIESRLYGREVSPKPKIVDHMVAHDFRRHANSQAGVSVLAAIFLVVGRSWFVQI